MFYLYNLILYILLPFAIIIYLPFFLYKKKHRDNFLSRLRIPSVNGVKRVNGGPRIWIHAVSVGEVITSIALIRGLREVMPDSEIYLSTITVTGHRVAKKKAYPLVNKIFFLPFDLYHLMVRAIRALSPHIVIIMETELWPNFIEAAKREGAKVVIVNGRISDESFRRYGKISFFLKYLLKKIDLFMMQSARDLEKIKSLGAEDSKTLLMKNLKYDLKKGDGARNVKLLNAVQDLAGGRPVLVIGSTHEGEEGMILESVPVKEKNMFVILAPRHPERFERVYEIVKERGYSVAKRSQLFSKAPLKHACDILILDSIGELSVVYSAAHIVIIGGSFVPVGGHNVLEPAAYGVPVITGPYYNNFSEIVEEMQQREAIVIAREKEDLQSTIQSLLDDRPRWEEISENAALLVKGYSGLGESVAKNIHTLINR